MNKIFLSKSFEKITDDFRNNKISLSEYNEYCYKIITRNNNIALTIGVLALVINVIAIILRII